jgi:hypothetical protein
MYLRGEEQLVYEQTSKDHRISHPGGTPSGCEHRRCVLGLPASLRMPSTIMEINRREASRVLKRYERKVKDNRFDWVTVALNRPWSFIYIYREWGGLPLWKAKNAS